MNRLCQIVYETTNLSIALTNNKLELLDHSEDWSWKEYLDRFSLQNIGRFSPIGCDLNQTSIYGFCYRSIFLNKLDIHLFFIPIYQNQSLSHYIILKTNSTVEEIEATILSKIENIKSIFLLKQVLEQEFKKNNNYFRNIIFDDLLKITEPNEDLLRKYSLSLGQEIHSDLQVLLISDILQSKDILAFENVFLQLTNHLLASQINLQHVHFFSRNQEILLVLGKDSTLLKQLDLVKDIVIDFTGHKHFYIGISSIKPYWKLSIALDEARQAIGFAKSNLKSQQIQYYQDIGILKLLTNDQGAINQLFVNELFDQFLSPLLKYDDKNHTQLYPTLVTFFDNHFSYTESSQILFIHVNTLRARLSKIESLLSISLKNTDQVMSVHLAIRLYQSQLQA
ncbi:helix-turn-helix domain-containing protein [Streptococcus didelphis]|uniref:PucR family transcriptional regulator n=1 Tax=Streptococcus didelphis TaxID=102886 RepID=UPI0027D24950|nr:helix-turn-helix domain-containing protein [Streptococcus didelphis]WMB29565.1 helix-turn-helix domain-containing protein [Streptococcus didelphis]